MKISLDHIEDGLELEIRSEGENHISLISESEAFEYGEACIQLVEGCTYEYQFNLPNFKFKASHKNRIISFSQFDSFKGIIRPNIYVGTHSLEIADNSENLKGIFFIEVQSVKSSYRDDYRTMLKSITEKCTDLVMQIDSPVSQTFETNFDEDSMTLYQRFSFVKALIDSTDFEESIQMIVSNPATKWKHDHEDSDIRKVKRVGNGSINQILSKSSRIGLPPNHLLRENYKIQSLPNRIIQEKKIESIDTAENRFVKHALEEFLFFCESCFERFEVKSRAKLEAEALVSKLSNRLNQNFFKEISRPNNLSLNNPLLQRKSGYREVLNGWLKFNLAAKLVWKGGDDVYQGGKKDVATLYEYWLFFTLLDLFRQKDVFNISPKNIQELIQFENGRLSVKLKQGKNIAMKGVFETRYRKLNVQFSYNRSFGGGKAYPKRGSYTTTLRPDYTLSIWPIEIENPNDAEETEQITHIHFDAKYKVDNFFDLIKKSKEEDLNQDEIEELDIDEAEERKKGTFKNQDLLKMHAYKDAIRRTGGAYILYPGEGKAEPFRGFRELIPGLGAFVLKPSENVSGIEELRRFIVLVISNFIDRASQRENTSTKVYNIHKNKKDDNDILEEPIPEYFDLKREKKIVPDETFVLIGFCKNLERLKWHNESNLYTFRMNDKKGSLILEPDVVGAKFLLLRESGNEIASKLYRILSTGPRVYSRLQLEELNFPDAKQDYYLVIEIEKVKDEDFRNAKWDYKKLDKYQSVIDSEPNSRIGPGIPFAVPLTDLMKVIKK